MFNAPRPAQRYASAPVNGLGGSFVDENPLAASIYDDPWSAAPSPSPQPVPGPGVTTALSSVIGVHSNERSVIIHLIVEQRKRMSLIRITEHLQS